MFNFLKSLFSNKEDQQQLENLKKQVDQLQTSLKEKEREQKKQGALIEIRGERIDENKGILLDLEWNDDFIRYLKENGITGKSDEEIVKNYLVRLYAHLASRLEEEEMKKQDEKGNISDFT